jgi:hypothetical protein
MSLLRSCIRRLGQYMDVGIQRKLRAYRMRTPISRTSFFQPGRCPGFFCLLLWHDSHYPWRFLAYRPHPMVLPFVWNKRPTTRPHPRHRYIYRRHLRYRALHPALERPRTTTRSGTHTTDATAYATWHARSDMFAPISKDELIPSFFTIQWGDRPAPL